ncbi:SRPBCC family protein [Thermodesulfobacteriota bacterium]
MVNISVEGEFEFSAEKLWGLISNFGEINWVPGLEKVELEGEGVGMVRHVYFPLLPKLEERLDAINYEKMIVDYSIPSVEYIKVKNYRARAQVIELDSEHCKVVWSCVSAEADGATEAQATANTEALYKDFMTWIYDFLKKKG